MLAMSSALDLNKIAASFWRVMCNYLPISLLEARRHRLRASPKQAIWQINASGHCLTTAYESVMQKMPDLERHRFFGTATATVVARR